MVRNVNWEDEDRMDIGDAADNVTESLTRGDDMKSVLKTLEILIKGAKQFFNKEEIASENVINEIVKKYRAQKKVNKVQKKENEDISDNGDMKSVMTKKSKKQENVTKQQIKLIKNMMKQISIFQADYESHIKEDSIIIQRLNYLFSKLDSKSKELKSLFLLPFGQKWKQLNDQVYDGDVII
ncbi:MAG: hypothetical protein EZS28_016262 [Streblomastix strix]|uniref:Uncharacterized protein n=1 Tax=Streblomastix strix TaxID=222440 RepID=A0A5J4W0R4_9EUKA|nr:MAG: hypothetical protein EZS28_016262 [Streblomastix strix]